MKTEGKAILNAKKRNFYVLGLGEVMLRLSPIGSGRISHSDIFEKMAGGSELNIVSALSMLGLRSGIITKLPKSEIGRFIKYKIRYTGTSDDYIIYDESNKTRLGVYYYESGAYPRLPIALYDRQGSSFSTFKKEELCESVYKSSSVFHTSGITLALSDELCKNVLSVTESFRDNGALISFDVNYRSSLWSEEKAKATIERILPLTDILFISEETMRKMFSMSGELSEMQKTFSARFPNIRIIASTRRKIISPKLHSFSSLIYDAQTKTHYEEAEYERIDVVDRIGTGDAYIAGALYGLLEKKTVKDAVKYGNAMAAMKSTVMGDMTLCDLTDIERIIELRDKNGGGCELIR